MLRRLRNRLFPAKDWAAVVYDDFDAQPCPMSRLVGSDQILWGDSRNLTYRQAKRRCAAFNAGEN